MQTPYFVFKPDILKENYNEFDRLCCKYLDKFVIAYSVKTNEFLGVIEALNDLGSNFEVASLSEIKKVLDISSKSFIFNGCCKSEEELRIAIENKFLINVDSLSEINKISVILDDLEIDNFSIGLRVSLNGGKFGFGVDELKGVVSYCGDRGLEVISLHFHGGTNQTLEKYEDGLKGMRKVIDRAVGLGVKLKYVDLGGGFPDKFQLKNLGVELEDYFKLIEKYTLEFDVSVILEPGRCLVADAFDLITKVCVIKEKENKNYAILDVGINVLSKITLAGYKFKKVWSGQGNGKKDYVLVGPLLFNNDIVGRFNGVLEEGEILRVENVGAYCYNLAWEISYDKPKVYIE